MKLLRVKIRNILALREFEFSVRGKLTEISGENGEGKTTCLESIRGAISSGNIAHLLRKGEEQGDIVLDFDSGDVLTAKIKGGKTERTITRPAEGTRVMKVQEWLKARISQMQFNPVSFVTAQPKDRLEMLLKVTPLSLDPKELLQAVGKQWIPEDIDITSIGFGFEDPLKLVDRIAASIFEYRTGLNRSVRDKEGQISELQSTLPQEPVDASDPDGLEQKLKDKRAELASAKEAVEKLAADKQIEIDATAKRLEVEENERHTKALQTINEQRLAKTKELNRETTGEFEKLGQLHGPAIEELKEKVGNIKALLQQKGRIDKTRQIIEKITVERGKLNDEATDNTIALEKLAKLRAKMLETLPVKGLEIKDGQVYFDEILYDTVNHQKQVDIAMQLAAAGAGELKIICVDGLELMSTKKRKDFIAWAAKSEAQYFYCLVKDDAALEVKSVDPPTEEVDAANTEF